MSTIVSEQSGKPYSITLKNVDGQLTADQMEQVAEQLAAEWPDYEVTVEHYAGQGVRDALRQSTREHLPEVADALDRGDTTRAFHAFLDIIEAEIADQRAEAVCDALVEAYNEHGARPHSA